MIYDENDPVHEEALFTLRAEAQLQVFGSTLSELNAEFFEGDESFVTEHEAIEFCLEHGYDLRTDRLVPLRDWQNYAYLVEAGLEGFLADFEPDPNEISEELIARKLGDEIRQFMKKKSSGK